MSEFDFEATDGSFGLRFDRSRRARYAVRRFDRIENLVLAPDAMAPRHRSGVTIGYLVSSYSIDGKRMWIIRDPDGALLVSAAEGIGRGSCTTPDEAVTVLGWKLEGRRP